MLKFSTYHGQTYMEKNFIFTKNGNVQFTKTNIEFFIEQILGRRST